MNSKKIYRIAGFVLIGLLVMMIGGLAGWYVVLRQKGQTVSFSDAARGFGFGTPSASENGSTFENISGGGFAVGGGGDNGVLSGSDGTTGSINGGAAGNAAGSGENASFAPGNGDTLSGTSVGGTITTGTGRTSSTTTPSSVYKTPRLWRATKTPVAGFEFTTSSPAVYFTERATGHIFRADAATGEVVRRTNTLIPKVYEAFLGRDGSGFYQFINDTTGALETLNGKINASTTGSTGTFGGTNLRNNLMALDVNPDTKTLFYISAEEGGYTGYTQTWVPGKNSTEKKVFSSLIGSWKIFTMTDARLIISQKPQDGLPGYAFEVSQSGRLVPIIRAAPGLTILPLSGSKVLIFGTSAANTLTLFAQTATTTLMLPIKTVADKCVWSPYRPANGRTPATDLVVYCAVPRDASAKNFLQNWYMGALHTSDSWWRINLSNGKSDQIFAGDSEGGIDVVDPAIDPSGAIIAFKNGRDGALWLLRIVK